MSYPALPGRAMPYHMDGTVVKAIEPGSGVVYNLTAADNAELNDYDYVNVFYSTAYPNQDILLVFSFPEKRHLRGLFARCLVDSGNIKAPRVVEGSNDTTNGIDGTWVQAVPDDNWGNDGALNFDAWRYPSSGQFPGDGAYKVWRIGFQTGGSSNRYRAFLIAHLYGHKAAGETPDDILFVDPTTGAELSLPLNYGAVPAGQSSIMSAALKNASASLTAQNITIAVNDPDDIIRVAWADTGPWQTSLTISSLAPGAQSATIFVKAEPPAPPTPLKPHRAPIEVTVGAWV